MFVNRLVSFGFYDPLSLSTGLCSYSKEFVFGPQSNDHQSISTSSVANAELLMDDCLRWYQLVWIFNFTVFDEVNYSWQVWQQEWSWIFQRSFWNPQPFSLLCTISCDCTWWRFCLSETVKKSQQHRPTFDVAGLAGGVAVPAWRPATWGSAWAVRTPAFRRGAGADPPTGSARTGTFHANHVRPLRFVEQVNASVCMAKQNKPGSLKVMLPVHIFLHTTKLSLSALWHLKKTFKEFLKYFT